jgi:hypothetical protein
LIIYINLEASIAGIPTSSRASFRMSAFLVWVDSELNSQLKELEI